MLENLFRHIAPGGIRGRMSIVPTERGHTRFLLGAPQELSIEQSAFGSRVPYIEGKRIIGAYGFFDLSPDRAYLDINGQSCTFDVYVIEHLGVDPTHRGQGFGMSLLELAGHIARQDRRHLTGSPNNAAESLRRKFSRRHKGCLEYRDHNDQSRLFTYLHH